MKLCVAYCRVSTVEQDKSIEAQKEQWRELFREEGYNPAKVGMLYKKDGTKQRVQGIFADEGISGTSLRNRKAFESMLDYAKKKAFDIIYVEDISRFTRNVEDGIKVIKDLRELGVAVYFRKENINTLRSDKDFEITLRMAIYQEESRVKSERLKWAVNRLHKKGGWNAGKPYGYDIENGFLKIANDEAETVRLIFNMFVNNGDGIGKVARYLNNSSIPTKKGTQWSQPQIATILDNPIYTGEQRTHTVETIDINRKLRAEVPREEQIVHHFEHLRIIDDELFRLAQLERKKRHDMFNRHTGHSNTHLLSSLLYCGCCGGNYKRKKRHSYRRKDGTQLDIGYEWTCAINDMYGKTKCSHRVAIIETDAIELIKQEITNLKQTNLDKLFELYLKVKFDYNVDKDSYSNLIKQKDKIAREIEILRSDLAEGLIEKEMYKEQMKALNEKAVGLTAEIERINRHDIEIENAKLKYKQFLDYIQSIDIDNLTNTGLKKIFRQIDVYELEFEGNKEKCLGFCYEFMDMSVAELIKKATGKDLGIDVHPSMIPLIIESIDIIKNNKGA